MTRTTLLLALLLLGLIVPGPALAAASGSGGALAQPLRQGAGGGSVAPTDSGQATDALSGDEAASPMAEPAGESTATEGTVERGEDADDPAASPQEWPAVPAGEPPPTGRDTADGPGARAASNASEEEADPSSAIGSLPFTGLEVAALAAIGLGLLLGGIAFRRRMATGSPRR